jgi:hypothetical protein
MDWIHAAQNPTHGITSSCRRNESETVWHSGNIMKCLLDYEPIAYRSVHLFHTMTSLRKLLTATRKKGPSRTRQKERRNDTQDLPSVPNLLQMQCDCAGRGEYKLRDLQSASELFPPSGRRSRLLREGSIA